MPRRESAQDEEFDVVVIGSGGAGLTAAILAHDHGAQVVVLERSDKIGGTTAVSGGGVWIPRSDHMAEVGMTDSRDEALAYCKVLVAGQAGDDLVEAFVDTAHKMVRYLEAHTPLKFTPWTIPDYHPNVVGAKPRGRSIEPAIFDKRALGSWETALRQSPFYFIPLTLQEVLFTYQGHVRPQNLPPDVILERMERGLTTCGNALVAALLKACLDRAVAFRLDTRARELVLEDGCVTGVRAEAASGDLLVRARKGVVLASGGFEWNDALKARYLPGPVSHPSSPPQNEGDGLLMAIEAGAALGNMSEVWGSPAAPIPGELYDGRDLSRLVVPERACPHAILVNQRGERFVNEGTTYNELGKVFHERDTNTGAYCNLPCWAILDGQYRSRYPILTVLPGDPDPEWLPKADTLEELALKVGIDPQGLAATGARWNGFVREGQDADFGRHRSPMDPSAAHPSMGTIETPPFYALPVYQGTLGTKGGPLTNVQGQVVNVRGDVIPGLFAAGNVMAGVSGPAYFGGGATIGLAMTWGYVCGINAARPTDVS